VRGQRRVRAVGGALHGVGEFVSRLEVLSAGPHMSAEERDAWLAAASGLRADLEALLGTTAR